MGLLSDPQRRKKLMDSISFYNNKLCLLCYTVGVIWFLALAYPQFNGKTYFSENALLPGLVDGYFHSGYVAEQYFEDLKREIKKDKRIMPQDWIQQQFENIGLDTFVQNYTFKYPYNIIGSQTVQGANVYGILRGARTASTEALVLSVPFRPPVVDTLPKTHGGLALMLAAAKHFRKFTFWSKDIIFLVVQHEHIGMQAWLDSYHSSSVSEYIHGDDLRGRSGSIQAAINLEIATNRVTDMSLRLQGLNGQLPNLDLVNLVVRLCRQHSVNVRIHNQRDFYDPESVDGYLHSLKTMATMMWHQLPGVQQGNHGLFHRYHIEALTLVSQKKRGAHSIDFTAMGRILEGVLRSLNNLLERFHQSFFFYLMPATERYVSIGLYMPPFGLIAVGVLIKALALWISSGLDDAPTPSDKESQATDSGESEEINTSEDTVEESQTKEEDSPQDGTTEEPKNSKDQRGLLSLLPVIIVCCVFSIAAYQCVGTFIESALILRMSASDGLFYGVAAMFGTSAVLLARKMSVFDLDLTSLKCVTLIFEGLVLASVSLINISLATLVAVLWVPISVMAVPSTSRLLKCVQSTALLLVSPLAMLFLAAVLHEYCFHNANSTNVLTKAWAGSKDWFLSIVIDSMMLSNWTFSVVCLAFYPNWLMLWALVHSAKPVDKIKTD